MNGFVVVTFVFLCVFVFSWLLTAHQLAQSFVVTHTCSSHELCRAEPCAHNLIGINHSSLRVIFIALLTDLNKRLKFKDKVLKVWKVFHSVQIQSNHTAVLSYLRPGTSNVDQHHHYVPVGLCVTVMFQWIDRILKQDHCISQSILILSNVHATWRRLPGRWAGPAGFPVCRRWGSFWWWRSTWQVGWTSRATPDQTPRSQRRSPTFSPSLMDRSSPGSYQPPGTQCQMGSTWWCGGGAQQVSVFVYSKLYNC